MPESLPAGHRWFQFRLRTILLVMLIIGLAVAHFRATRLALELESRNRELESINSKLRAEAGYLEIDDPSKAVVLRLQNLEENTWQWKVWLPSGRWMLGCMTEGIPRQGVPDAGSCGPLDGGREVPANVTLRKDSDGKWNFRFGVDGTAIGNAVNESNWLIKKVDGASLYRPCTTEIAGDKTQAVLEPSQPVVLMRLQAHEVIATPNGGWEGRENVDNSDGIMVWLNRAK
ncbi:MAG TPA: hypothetical protein VGG64_01935 [Pirellulales bacterium]|jgi:hypothetical protein